MNEIYVISPYKHHGTWVFDDARVGLLQEPFVAGADTWMDRVVADIPNAAKESATSIGLIGGGPKMVEIGITRLIWRWRDGCVRLCSDISPTPQPHFTPR
jgi:hypothetical protein